LVTKQKKKTKKKKKKKHSGNGSRREREIKRERDGLIPRHNKNFMYVDIKRNSKQMSTWRIIEINERKKP
jgi:hypothetical protein